MYTDCEVIFLYYIYIASPKSITDNRKHYGIHDSLFQTCEDVKFEQKNTSVFIDNEHFFNFFFDPEIDTMFNTLIKHKEEIYEIQQMNDRLKRMIMDSIEGYNHQQIFKFDLYVFIDKTNSKICFYYSFLINKEENKSNYLIRLKFFEFISKYVYRMLLNGNIIEQCSKLNINCLKININFLELDITSNQDLHQDPLNRQTSLSYTCLTYFDQEVSTEIKPKDVKCPILRLKTFEGKSSTNMVFNNLYSKHRSPNYININVESNTFTASQEEDEIIHQEVREHLVINPNEKRKFVRLFVNYFDETYFKENQESKFKSLDEISKNLDNYGYYHFQYVKYELDLYLNNKINMQIAEYPSEKIYDIFLHMKKLNTLSVTGGNKKKQTKKKKRGKSIRRGKGKRRSYKCRKKYE
jgi:hypothetical protein